MMQTVNLLGWLACVAYSTIPSFWLLIHPFAEHWRSRRRSPYLVLLPAWIVMWMVMTGATVRWRHVVLCSTRWPWIPAGALFAVGFWLYWQSIKHFSAQQLSGSPELVAGHREQRLVTSGIRARVRHPVYLAHLCEMLAWSLGTGLAVCYGLTAFAVITGAVMIRMEEEELEQRFGIEYRNYRAGVPAIIPSRKMAHRPFSGPAGQTTPKKIFVAFTGPKSDQDSVYQIVPGYECWNLGKVGFDDFIAAVQAKIPPVNDTVLQKNYKKESKSDERFGMSAEQYEKCSWGLLLPALAPDAIGPSYGEVLFILNLYSPRFLYPVFSVSELGIWRPDHRRNPLLYYAEQNQAERFSRAQFATFYDMLISESGYAVWQANRAARWAKEDWRLFVACLMFTGLTTYDAGKSPFTWQREAADIATILEALCTAGSDDTREVGYKLRKRVAALMSHRFPDIEQQVKELYRQRSAFVHGSFYQSFAKKGVKAKKSALFAELPMPSFEMLYRHKEYVRQTLAAYLYLNKVRRLDSSQFGQAGSVLDILEASVIDTDLRAKVATHAEKVLSLM